MAAKRYRVIVPYLRGYGSTRFLSPDTLRNGQQSALGADVIALMDALKIEQAVIGGILIAFMKPMMIVFDSDSPKPAK